MVISPETPEQLIGKSHVVQYIPSEISPSFLGSALDVTFRKDALDNMKGWRKCVLPYDENEINVICFIPLMI